MQLVVSDASPLTGLLHIGRAELLKELFSFVIVPPAVHAELLHDHPELPDWVEVMAPGKIASSVAAAKLDRGETEAISLALEVRPDLLLLDERKGRRFAESQGLSVTGLLGVLILAKRHGHITAVMPIIDELRRTARCWFADRLVETIRLAAGE